jgi:hypothetical protein
MTTPVCVMHDPSANFKDFNDGCFCIKKEITTPYNMFFARTQIFLSSEIIFRLQDSVMVLEKTINSEAFKRKVFKEKYDEIKSSHVEGGVLMSYDFHIDGDVPKLIEINTNAGGAFLNYELCKVMQECCTKTQRQDISHFEEAIVAMFKEEFAKKSDKCLETVAIVDDAPERQFLYQEFLLCKEILERHGITTYIVDPKVMLAKGSVLYVGDVKIDLMYNRLTDFYFTEEDHKKFLQIFESNQTIITPNKDDYKLFADKINLIYLQDDEFLATILSKGDLTTLKRTILETVVVNPSNEAYIWENRKKYFFKPCNGFGGRGAYNGRGLTKQTWQYIKNNNYLAQEIVAANTRVTKEGDDKDVYKFDIRAYTYRGKVLLLAARMYQGQTTNFRTVGGGFAPILITDK